MNSEGMRYCTGMSDAIQIEPSTGFCRYFPRAISREMPGRVDPAENDSQCR